jgi:hypothetical protein
MIRDVCLIGALLVAVSGLTSPTLPEIKTSLFSMPATPPPPIRTSPVSTPPAASVFGYVPVYIPGTVIPYVYTPVMRAGANDAARNVTGFARFITKKGVYGFTPLVGENKTFNVGNLTMYSASAEAIMPLDMLPVYAFPTRSGVLPTVQPIGFIPVFAASGVEQKKSLASMGLDNAGRNKFLASSSWDSSVFRDVKPPLFIVRPIVPAKTSRPQTTSRRTTPPTTPVARSTVAFFPDQFGSFFLTVSQEGVLRVVTSAPPGPPVGRISVFSNDTNATESFFIPVFPGKMS